MDVIALFLGLVIIITIGGVLFILSHTPGKQGTSAEKIKGTDFIPSQMYMGSDGLGGLAVNEHTHHICLMASPTSPARVLPIDDLVGSYLIKNGELLGEGKRSQPKEVLTFLREFQRKKDSLISSLHLGGWSSEGNQQIDLIIAVHDEQDPLQVVNFLNMETKEGSLLFEKALSTATHWHNVLDGLILLADHRAQVHSQMLQEEMTEATL